jgi:hypothetical protein
MRKPMRKIAIAAAAFIISAALGVGLLVVATVLLAVIHVERQHTSGIAAVAGGLSSRAVLLVPILSGILGAVLALRSVNRTEN